MEDQDDWEKKEQEFKDDLASVINKHSREAFSNTPDFIIAEYLYGCLEEYQDCIRKTFDWYKSK